MTAGLGPAFPLFARGAEVRMPVGWTGPGLCSSVRAQSAIPAGEVAERLNAPVLKTGEPSRAPWVRIPPSPPDRNIDPIEAARVPDARGFFHSGARK